MTPFEEAAARAIERCKQFLGPAGWQWETFLRPDVMHVVVTHALSSQKGYVIDDRAAPEQVESLMGFFGSREVAVVARAPKPCPHAELLGRLRVAASFPWWDSRVLTQVAGVLMEQGLLTEEETLWLCEAGPVWSEDTPK